MMMKKTIWLWACLLAVVLLTVQVWASDADQTGKIQSTEDQPAFQYGSEWQTTTPEACGFDSEKLAEIPELEQETLYSDPIRSRPAREFMFIGAH